MAKRKTRRTSARSSFDGDNAVLLAWLTKVQTQDVFPEEAKTDIERHFRNRSLKAYKNSEAAVLRETAIEIARRLSLTSLRIGGINVVPHEQLSPSPSDVETTRSSLEDTRRSFQTTRKPHIEQFQRQLDELAGTKYESRQERKDIVDEVNATRRILAVAFFGGNPAQRVTLCIASSSFQLKTSGSKTHIYSGTAFPVITVQDLEGY